MCDCSSQYEDRSKCGIQSQNIKRASCEHCLRQATKAKQKTLSQSTLKQATTKPLLDKKNEPLSAFRHWPGPRQKSRRCSMAPEKNTLEKTKRRGRLLQADKTHQPAPHDENRAAQKKRRKKRQARRTPAFSSTQGVHPSSGFPLAHHRRHHEAGSKYNTCGISKISKNGGHRVTFSFQYAR